MARPDQGSQFNCDDWWLFLKAHMHGMSRFDGRRVFRKSAPSRCKTELSAMPHTE